ncbi:MAG: hybrid sensor histidine kinase/response regulator, partial [Deltaproteobacteria bacterium]|nr:hybrid sensor histidine kinase/response regulator [Deltaproteobacteria bacterium]
VPLQQAANGELRLDPAAVNRRILVIDDNPRIHDDFRTILVRDTDGVDFLLDMEAELFGEPEPRRSPEVSFEVDSAYQGREGLELVRRAKEEERPYAMAFVDVRMPPGWDGIETIKRIWEVDPDLQVVICTAYSDYSWEETVEILDPCERFLMLKKPFDTVVVRQLAHSLTEKWQLYQQAKQQLTDLRHAVDERSRDLERAHHQLQREAEERRKVETALRRAWELEPEDRAEDEIGALQDSFTDLNQLLASYQALLSREVRPGDPDAPVDTDLDDLLREIPAAVSRTLTGIDQVTVMVRALKEAGVEPSEAEPDTVDLNKIVAGALTDTLDEYVYVAEVECDYGQIEPTKGDAGDLSEALRILLVNAANAISGAVGNSGQKGTIRVRTAMEGDRTVISVSDTGGGIPDQIGDQIFEPFFTTWGGGGQGLAVARSIVEEKHGGSLTYETELGKGTTFLVKLPL